MDAALNWDEFRLVKAIADTRSLAGAAAILGLNHSTVFRRLGALERAVGAPLFERSRAGYHPTAAGDEMIALANRMSDFIVEFERRVAGRDIKPTGRLTVTTVEAIGQRFMPAILAQFQVQNPGVVIDLILSERELNLSRRDADVAIRVTNEPPETLVGRRICSMRWGVYCRRDLADRIGPDAIDTLPFAGFARRFRTPPGAPVDRSERPAGAPRRARQLGPFPARDGRARLRRLPAAVLPRRTEPRVDAARPDPAEWDLGLWILTHSDLRRSARVRAFMDFAGAEFAKHRRSIEGAESE